MIAFCVISQLLLFFVASPLRLIVIEFALLGAQPSISTASLRVSEVRKSLNLAGVDIGVNSAVTPLTDAVKYASAIDEESSNDLKKAWVADIFCGIPKYFEGSGLGTESPVPFGVAGIVPLSDPLGPGLDGGNEEILRSNSATRRVRALIVAALLPDKIELPVEMVEG